MSVVIELSAWEATDLLQEFIGFGALVDLATDIAGNDAGKAALAMDRMADLVGEIKAQWRQPGYAKRHNRWARHLISQVVAGLNNEVQLQRITQSGRDEVGRGGEDEE